MPRIVDRLTPLKVKNIVKPGLYADGGGLNLSVSKTGAKSWIYRYSINGKRREMGLGSCLKLSLADARKSRDQASSSLAAGLDPLQERKLLGQKRRCDPTFSQCAEDHISTHKAGWKSVKHTKQWGNTLKALVYPVIGDLPTDQITTDHILEILRPIWLTKSDTARKVRGRIETILDVAKTRGLRQGENPARLKGHLDHLLPSFPKSKRVKHHPFLPWQEVGEFYSKLKRMPGIAPKALQLLICTGCRSIEARGARWEEFDFETKTWTVVAERMKGGVEFRVPLNTEAISLLESLPRLSELVFPSDPKGVVLSDSALLAVRSRMGYGGITVHGFRTTLRTWLSDYAEAPRDVGEAALAHKITNQVEASYARTDHLERRRKLMELWAQFLRGDEE